MWSPQSRLAVDFFPGLPFPNSPRLRVRFFFSSKVAVIHAGALKGGIFPEFESRKDAELFTDNSDEFPRLNGTHSTGEEVNSDQVFGTPLIPIIQIAKRKRISQVAGPICEVCPTIPARTGSASRGSKSEETLS